MQQRSGSDMSDVTTLSLASCSNGIQLKLVGHVIAQNEAIRREMRMQLKQGLYLLPVGHISL